MPAHDERRYRHLACKLRERQIDIDRRDRRDNTIAMARARAASDPFSPMYRKNAHASDQAS